MRTFVIGDIHGSYRALRQVFELSQFDYINDTLISLGDVSDGWTETAESLEELLKIRNLKFVRGNHDQWLKDWLKNGKKPDVWTMQGGKNTIKSYERNPHLKEKHLEFLKKTPFYYLDDENRLFVHGGITPGIPIERQDNMTLMWDRQLLKISQPIISEYNEVYLGHTSIYKYSTTPLQQENIWFMDTGAGWEGVLSMMDIDTKEVFQSDLVSDLYPEETGRN